MIAESKQDLRKRLRAMRREHVDSLPDSARALMFYRPPVPIVEAIAPGSAIGLYAAAPFEAPALAYAKWFHERGHDLALPFFGGRDAAMEFRRWHDPYDENELVDGPYGIAQPPQHAEALVPDTIFVPLVGFTGDGQRLGQGGGHYDRWLAANPGALAIGLAWDCQLVDTVPVEAHDRALDIVVTPTRAFERSRDA